MDACSSLGVLLIIVGVIWSLHARPGRHLRLRAGLALVLKTSMWAKRRYVRFKRWQPKAGRWADWGLRRRSARAPREPLRKAEQEPNRCSRPSRHRIDFARPLPYRRAQQRLP